MASHDHSYQTCLVMCFVPAPAGLTWPQMHAADPSLRRLKCLPVALAVKHCSAEIGDRELLTKDPLARRRANQRQHGLGDFQHVLDNVQKAQVGNERQRLDLALEREEQATQRKRATAGLEN